MASERLTISLFWCAFSKVILLIFSLYFFLDLCGRMGQGTRMTSGGLRLLTENLETESKCWEVEFASSIWSQVVSWALRERSCPSGKSLGFWRPSSGSCFSFHTYKENAPDFHSRMISVHLLFAFSLWWMERENTSRTLWSPALQSFCGGLCVVIVEQLCLWPVITLWFCVSNLGMM